MANSDIEHIQKSMLEKKNNPHYSLARSHIFNIFNILNTMLVTFTVSQREL